MEASQAVSKTLRMKKQVLQPVKAVKIKINKYPQKKTKPRYTACAFVSNGVWSRLDTHDLGLARVHVGSAKVSYIQDNMLRSLVK